MLRLHYLGSIVLFLFKQKTAYEMRSSDCSSDVCAAGLPICLDVGAGPGAAIRLIFRDVDAGPVARLFFIRRVVPAGGGRRGGQSEQSCREDEITNDAHGRALGSGLPLVLQRLPSYCSSTWSIRVTGSMRNRSLVNALRHDPATGGNGCVMAS